MKQQPNGVRPEEIEKVLGAYGYIPARQKGSHKHYLNKPPKPDEMSLDKNKLLL